ncbi:MAG: hypothetical protein EOM50_11260 [Erysipelotrichia bacterium]|nr:hypothetical protein [Erysipelotrichia bacterium]NCC54222.1 hypothetical protein [Erysipelotrichia bacterium]
MCLSYEHKFILSGPVFSRYQMMSKEFRKYIYMYGRKRTVFNAYEMYAMHFFSDAYQGRNDKTLITWVKKYLEQRDIVLSDVSFRWYIANIMIMFYYFFKKKGRGGSTSFRQNCEQRLHSEIDE